MKVLTLHQPYASLIVSGLKTIETRGWSTKYRGSLAVHAAARRVPTYVHHNVNADLPPVLDSITMSRYWEWTEHPDDPMHGGAYRWAGPLGAIVATCTLADVVPIHEWGCECDHGDVYALVSARYRGEDIVGLFSPGMGNYRHPTWTMDKLDCLDVRHPRQQAPYGDYRCGRFAWLLDGITPLDPVPFRGGQGLTREWTP